MDLRMPLDRQRHWVMFGPRAVAGTSGNLFISTYCLSAVAPDLLFDTDEQIALPDSHSPHTSTARLTYTGLWYGCCALPSDSQLLAGQ